MPLEKTADGKDIIQEGMLSIKVRNIKFFSLSTSFLAISCQPLIYMKAVMNGTANSWTIPIFAVFAAFAVATPVLLHYVTKRYITQVCYDPVKDTYTATAYNIFVREKKVEIDCKLNFCTCSTFFLTVIWFYRLNLLRKMSLYLRYLECSLLVLSKASLCF